MQQKTRSLRIIRPILIALALLAGARAQAAGTVVTWNIEGVTRQALVFTPTASASTKAPVVFFFHGHGGNMNQGGKSPNAIQNLWPEAIVVYPQGLLKPSHRNPQKMGPGWQDAKGEYGDRDLKFVDAMISTLREKYAADDKRVYAAGFSNGAVFSYLLWAERAQSFAAFGIVAGRLDDAEHLTTPRPVSIIAGRSDPVLPFEMQQEAMNAARQIDGATGAGQSCGQICTAYAASSPTPVVTRIHPGGHQVPPVAGRAFVDFFKAHTL